MFKIILTSSTVLCGLAVCQAALAQQTASTGALGIEEVIVTAQRRAENLQAVPISITALSADSLAANGIQSTTDLTQMVPGLLYGRSTNFNQPSIRGIGTRNAASGDEPNVATYIDGVYQPNSVGTPFELSNIEQIQVLKGPQGTLYGRNATGGSIIITTRKPSFDWTGSVSAGYGSFNYHKVAGFVSGPIVDDKVAASISAVNFGDEGYVHNIYLNRNDGRSRGTAVRGKILFQVSDDLSFQLNGFWSRSFNNVLTAPYSLGGNNQARSFVNSAVLNPNGLPLTTLVADKPYTTASFISPQTRARQQFVDGHVDWDFGWAKLSGVVSANLTRSTNLSLTEASPLFLSRTNYSSSNHDYNQELVLTSADDGPVTWLVGATGFEASDNFPLISTSRNTTTGATTPSYINYGQTTKAAAGFGEVTWQALDHLFLTGGARYSWDRKGAYNQTNTAAAVRASSSFYNLSPRGVVRYEWTPDISTYFSFTQGYKSGGFNATSAAGVVVASTGGSAAVRPETVDSYELGVKAKLGDNVRVNLAGYHYDYSNLQVSAAVIDPITKASLTNLQNAGKARVNGLEADVDARLTEAFSVNGTASIMKGTIRDFPNAFLPIPKTNLANCVAGGTPALTGNVSCTVNVTGNDLIRAPRYTFTVGGTYQTKVRDGALTVNANMFFSGKYYADLANTVTQPAYEILNASVTWRTPAGQAFFTFYGNNLTDQVYAVGHLVSAFGTLTQAAKPRTFGVTVGYDF